MRTICALHTLLLAIFLVALIASPSCVAAAGFPQKGKPISLIVPYAAGGANDIGARVLAPYLEKELGTSVQVVDKPGAAGQVGNTAIATSKPDGYTIGYIVFAPAITAYLDPDRKAVFNRSSFQTLGTHFLGAIVMSVPMASPYKTVADLVEAAKAKPFSIKAGNTGLMGTPHLASLLLQRVAGVKFSPVDFPGGAPAMNALVGEHIDVLFNGESEVVAAAKAGQIRVLATFGTERLPLLPDVKTMQEQGFKAVMITTSGVCSPAGIPKEAIQAYSAAIKKTVTSKEHQDKMRELGFTPYHLGPEEYAAHWVEYEESLKPLMKMAKEEIRTN